MQTVPACQPCEIRASHQCMLIATTNSSRSQPVVSLGSNFTASASNQIWTSDIVDVATARGCPI